MEEELGAAQGKGRFNIVKHLAAKFGMTEYEVKEYIGLYQKIVDNLLFMGIDMKMDGVLKSEHTMTGVSRKKIAWNKVYVEGLLRGEYKNQYICEVNKKRQARSKGSVTKKST